MTRTDQEGSWSTMCISDAHQGDSQTLGGPRLVAGMWTIQPASWAISQDINPSINTSVPARMAAVWRLAREGMVRASFGGSQMVCGPLRVRTWQNQLSGRKTDWYLGYRAEAGDSLPGRRSEQTFFDAETPESGPGLPPNPLELGSVPGLRVRVSVSCYHPERLRAC